MSSFSGTSEVPGFPVSFLYQSPQKVTHYLSLGVLITHIPFPIIISSCAFHVSASGRLTRCSPTPSTAPTAPSLPLPLWFSHSPSPLDSVQGERLRLFCPLCSILQFDLPLKPTKYLKRKAKNLHMSLSIPIFHFYYFSPVTICLRVWISSLLLCLTQILCLQSFQIRFLNHHFPYLPSIISFRASLGSAAWLCSPSFCLLSWNIPSHLPPPGESGCFILPGALLPLNHDSESLPQTGELSPSSLRKFYLLSQFKFNFLKEDFPDHIVAQSTQGQTRRSIRTKCSCGH